MMIPLQAGISRILRHRPVIRLYFRTKGWGPPPLKHTYFTVKNEAKPHSWHAVGWSPGHLSRKQFASFASCQRVWMPDKVVDDYRLAGWGRMLGREGK